MPKSLLKWVKSEIGVLVCLRCFSVYVNVCCVSVALIKQYDQGNSWRGGFIWSLQFLGYKSIAVVVGSMAVGRQAVAVEQ